LHGIYDAHFSSITRSNVHIVGEDVDEAEEVEKVVGHHVVRERVEEDDEWVEGILAPGVWCPPAGSTVMF